MDQTGAVLGPVMMAMAVAKANHFGPAFLRLAFPAAGALVALILARLTQPRPAEGRSGKQLQQALPKVFWWYVAASGVLAFGFIDFPLLSYHFQGAGMVKGPVIPLLYAGAMGLNGLTALVLGRLFDRFGLTVLSSAILVSLMTLPLGFLGGYAAAIASVACWAIGLGAQDACLRSGIAQVVSMNKRGSAFGAFNAVFGVLWFVGSAIMGLLCDRSVMALVILGMTAQFVAAIMFFRLRGPLAAAAGV
jgi:MFS family permease